MIQQVPDESVDLILTDPPYAGRYAPLITDLSRVAQRVLKPEGWLIVISGHIASQSGLFASSAKV